MGLLDKLADFLDDGKINGSADKSKFKEGMQKPAESQPAAASAAEEEAYRQGDCFDVRFGSSDPYNGQATVRIFGTVSVTVAAERKPKAGADKTIVSQVRSAISKALDKKAADGVPPEQLQAYAHEISRMAADIFNSTVYGKDYRIENIAIGSFTVS